MKAFTNNKQRMLDLLYKAWDKISWEVMDKSRSIMQCRGNNNYKQSNRPIIHNQGEKRQKDTGIAVDLSVNYKDYIACEDILARYNAQRPISICSSFLIAPILVLVELRPFKK